MQEDLKYVKQFISNKEWVERFKLELVNFNNWFMGDIKFGDITYDGLNVEIFDLCGEYLAKGTFKDYSFNFTDQDERTTRFRKEKIAEASIKIYWVNFLRKLFDEYKQDFLQNAERTARIEMADLSELDSL